MIEKEQLVVTGILSLLIFLVYASYIMDKKASDRETEIEMRAHTAVLSDDIEEMTDRDMQFHSTVTHTLYCSMEFSGVFKQIEIIKPVLVGMQGERILEKYSIPTIGSADISIAKSFLAKTDQQKRIFCDQLDKVFELSNKNTPASIVDNRSST